MVVLNHINSLLSREERNRLNENWVIIRDAFMNVQRQFNLLAGEDIDVIIQKIEEALVSSQTSAEILIPLIEDARARLSDIATEIARAQQATSDATEATTQATQATQAATTATNEAIETIQNAVNSIRLADEATASANTAAQLANENATSAQEAATLANNRAQEALNATQDATEATTNANTATTNATEAIRLSEEATSAANTATANAQQATEDANTATQAATNATQDSIEATSAANTATANAETQANRAETAANEAETILPNIRGWQGFITYNPDTTYVLNNLVTHEGNGYQLKVDSSKGVTPGSAQDTGHWLLVVRKGTDGQGAVQTVNGVEPGVDGNVVLPIIADYNELENIPQQFNPAPHNQAMGTITGLQNALDSLSAQISQISADGIPKLVSFKYTTEGTQVVDNKLTIPLESFTQSTDTLILVKNTTVLYEELHYTISGDTVILSESLSNPVDTTFYWLILKNVPIGPDGAINANVLADETVTKVKLEQSVQDVLDSVSTTRNKEVTIPSGITNIETILKSPVNVLRIDGRTILNLVPLFDSGAWTSQIGSSFATIVKPNKISVELNGTESFRQVLFVNVKPNTDYTLSYEGVGEIGIYTTGTAYIRDYSTVKSFTFNSGNNYTLRIFIRSTALSQTGTYTFENVSLVEGTQAQPFVANVKGLTNPTIVNETNGTSLVVPTTLYDGEYVEQNEKGELIKYKKWQELFLSDQLSYVTAAKPTNGNTVIDITGVQIPANTKILMVSYDGVLFNQIPAGTSMLAVPNNTIRVETNKITISISNASAGWGPNYASTPEEIKAFMLGWTMYQGGIGGSSPVTHPYNGTGVKAWARRDNNGNWGWSGNDYVPTTQAPINSKWQPYRLIHELATPVQEVIQPYSDLTLEKGENSVKVYAGRIVNEITKPYVNGGAARINNPMVAAGQSENHLLFRLKDLVNVRRNNEIDKVWDLDNNTVDTWGLWRLVTNVNNFDPTASYTVDYEPLYTWEVTAPIDSVQLQYYESLQAVTNELVHDVAKQQDTIKRMLENVVNDEEGIRWITPTLLGGLKWVNLSYLSAYGKDSSGVVHVNTFLELANTISHQVAFKLPVGYRPSKSLAFPSIHYTDSGTAYSGFVTVSIDGTVGFANSYSMGKAVHILAFSFKAEQ